MANQSGEKVASIATQVVPIGRMIVRELFESAVLAIPAFNGDRLVARITGEAHSSREQNEADNLVVFGVRNYAEAEADIKQAHLSHVITRLWDKAHADNAIFDVWDEAHEDHALFDELDAAIAAGEQQRIDLTAEREIV